MSTESIREEPLMDEEMKRELREMSPNGRATLRAWFDGNPHYHDLIAYIDRLDGKRSDA